MTAISTQPSAAQAAGQARGSRLARLLRGRPDDPAWARPALLALLLATALLYLAGLSRNGWANEFYAGAAQAGTESWKAFLFGSLTHPTSSPWTSPRASCGRWSCPPASSA
ncbi:MAG TPA: hypothetical protein VH642_04260 [Streptosporangiaceae bacterium]